MSACKLAHNVIEHSAGKLEPYIKKFLTSSLAGDGSSSNGQVDHHEIILDVYQCAPKVAKVVVPYITGELLVWSYSGVWIITWMENTYALTADNTKYCFWK
jgi:sister chromatid cohesion protein PDS5